MTKKYNKKNHFSYAIGAFPTIELIRNKPNNLEIIYIRTNSGKNSGVQKIINFCREKNLPIIKSNKVIEKVSKKKNVYVLAKFKKFSSPINPKADHLVLVNPNNRGNVGTTIRTMLGFGLKDLVIVGKSPDLFHPEAIRASMGALFSINYKQVATIKNYLARFKSRAYLFSKKAKTSLGEITFKKPAAFIFGNEADGLSSQQLKLGTSVSIPQSKKIDSFNLAVSTAIVLYENRRQKINQS